MLKMKIMKSFETTSSMINEMIFSLAERIFRFLFSHSVHVEIGFIRWKFSLFLKHIPSSSATLNPFIHFSRRNETKKKINFFVTFHSFHLTFSVHSNFLFIFNGKEAEKRNTNDSLPLNPN